MNGHTATLGLACALQLLDLLAPAASAYTGNLVAAPCGHGRGWVPYVEGAVAGLAPLERRELGIAGAETLPARVGGKRPRWFVTRRTAVADSRPVFLIDGTIDIARPLGRLDERSSHRVACGVTVTLVVPENGDGPPSH
jgi:hypothetical protein